MKRLLWAALVVACSKRQDPPPLERSPVVEPTPVASASAPPPAQPHWLRLPVALATASSELDKPNEKHLALHAFDGDPFTAWSESKDGPGKGEWLEGKLTQKRRIKRVRVVGLDVTSPAAGDLFVANAHPKKLTVTFDGGAAVTREVGEGDREVTLDVDVDAQTVRVTFDDVYEGKKWQDLTVAEVELYGDLVTPTAVVPEDIAERVKKLDDTGWKASTADATNLLLALAVPARTLKAYPLARVDEARAFRAQLDADSEQEGVIVITLMNGAELPYKTFAHTFFVFHDDDAHGRGVIGTRDVLTFRCLDKTLRDVPPEAGRPPRIDNVKLETKPAHAAFNDAVITWTSTTACDDVTKGEQGAMIVSLERGMAETLFAVREPFEIGSKTAHELQLDGPSPRTVMLVDGAKIDERRKFDASSFRYR